MVRYTDKQKLAAARDYCSGSAGQRAVARRHGVNVASLRLWAAAYRLHGAAGVRTKERKFYSAEFKLAVLERISAERLSYRQAAALFNIRNRDMILLWQRSYEIGGIAALHPHSGNRLITTMVNRADETSDPRRLPNDTRTREQLLEELRQLRMENAYLKKLKALAQADEPVHGSEQKPCKS